MSFLLVFVDLTKQFVSSKILSFAIFFAFFCRNSTDDKEANAYIDENPIHLNKDEEYLHSNQFYRPPIRANCLTEAELICARYHRLKQVRMWSIIREIFLYLCFLSLLSVIVYPNGDSNSYLQVKHLRKCFLNSRQMDIDYSKVCFLWFCFI